MQTMANAHNHGQMDDAASPNLASGSNVVLGSSGSADHAGESMPNVADLDPTCGGCKKAIDQESGGVVVAFGASLWHTDCFRCAKCSERVTADTNLLLLSDGSPVCGNCSYQCFVCKQAITEEAIMTGDESYHAHCFTCRSCSRRIEELVFAKTSQGIYCMACHNERVAKSRRHAEAKRNRAARKEREKEKEKERERERDREIQEVEPGQPPAQPASGSTDSSPLAVANQKMSSSALTSPNPSNVSQFSTPAATPVASGSGIFQDLVSKDADGRHAVTSPLEFHKEDAESSRSPSRSRTEGRDRDRLAESGTRERTISNSALSSSKLRQETLPLPSSPSGNLSAMRRKSFDESARSPVTRSSPLINHTQSPSLGSAPSLGEDPLPNPAVPRSANVGLGVGPVGLGVPMTKAEKRRSINPGMTFNLEAEALKADGRLTPLPPSPLRSSFTEKAPVHKLSEPRTPTSPVSNPFNHTTNLPTVSTQPATPRRAERDLTEQSLAPRKSSLPDQISALAKSPGRPDGTERTRTDSPSRRPPLGPRIQSGQSAKSSNRDTPISLDSPTHSSGRQTPTTESFDFSRQPTPGADDDGQVIAPRIDAPALPPMSFSLSDPDFALLLNDIHVTPRDGDKNKTPSTGSTIKVDTAAAQAEADKAEATLSTSPSIQRSPQMSTLSAAVNGEHSMLPPRIDSRGRLYEPKGDSPRLRVRQVSAESTSSVDLTTSAESVQPLLTTLLSSAKGSGQPSVEIDISLLEGVVNELDDFAGLVQTLKAKYNGARRSSQQYSEGLNVAGEEYDKEVALRREAEAEITRLRAALHGQTARLSVISGDERRQETMRRRSHDLAMNLSGLEKDISKLRAQRDISLAEVEELEASKSSDLTDAPPMDQSLTSRLDTIKEQYREELEPLTAQREALVREITELKESRDLFLEESSSLAAKNEDLAELNAQLRRQAETMQDSLSRQRPPTIFGKSRGHPSGSPSLSSLATSATLHEAPEETARVVKVSKPESLMEAAPRKFKWYKSSKGPETVTSSASISKPLGLPLDRNRNRPSMDTGVREHVFQQHSTMRFTRCEHCNDKMWGLQELRCAVCGVVCHAKCSDKLSNNCAPAAGTRGPDSIPEGPTVPSLFGRELSEQVLADQRAVPGIVTKCIKAVEANGMDYEGIYRKSGGSSQSKLITQLFEHNDLQAFDLEDLDTFNDISSITSVLKTYFRELPNPLLTHELHESFVAATEIKDAESKTRAMTALIQQLPKDHYNTLRVLMLHLNRVQSKCSINLMNARNIGTVFGPTLMRSAEAGREFGDMGGKTLAVSWMVENAASVFAEAR